MRIALLVIFLLCLAILSYLIWIKSRQSPKQVYADYFTNFQTRDQSGGASGWRYYEGKKVAWSGDLYTKPGSDRKDTSTPYYPLIHPYDTTDTDVLEYHILTAKLAGIDGFVCEFSREVGHEAEATFKLAELAKKYHFKIGIHWVAVNFTNRTPQVTTRSEMLQKATACLQTVLQKVYDVSGIKYNNRPLILLFGVDRVNHNNDKIKNTNFTLAEVRALKQSCKSPQPLFLAPHFEGLIHPELIDAVDGVYSWPKPSGSIVPDDSPYDSICNLDLQKERLTSFYEQAEQYQEQNKLALYLASIWPGFDDHKGRAWGEDLARYIPRENGRCLRQTWLWAKQSSAPIVLGITWNDWIESTSLEPSREFGFNELALCQKEISLWKEKEFNRSSLELPHRLFTIRKQLRYLSELKVSQSILTSSIQQADQIGKKLSRFAWKKAQVRINKLESSLNDIITKQVTIKSLRMSWSADSQHPFLEMNATARVTTDNNQNVLQLDEHIQLSCHPNANYLKGRLQLTYKANQATWFQIRQTSNQSRDLALFKTKVSENWQTIELDCLPVSITPENQTIAFDFYNQGNLSATILIKSISLQYEDHRLTPPSNGDTPE